MRDWAATEIARQAFIVEDREQIRRSSTMNERPTPAVP
jgi:hypothetical protein